MHYAVTSSSGRFSEFLEKIPDFENEYRCLQSESIKGSVANFQRGCGEVYSAGD
jgi:hypothetical protein